MTAAEIIVQLLTGYLGCGLLFAFSFVSLGVTSLDAHARGASWGFRILIIPGCMALWPLMLSRWIRHGGRKVTSS